MPVCVRVRVRARSVLNTSVWETCPPLLLGSAGEDSIRLGHVSTPCAFVTHDLRGA